MESKINEQRKWIRGNIQKDNGSEFSRIIKRYKTSELRIFPKSQTEIRGHPLNTWLVIFQQMQNTGDKQQTLQVNLREKKNQSRFLKNEKGRKYTASKIFEELAIDLRLNFRQIIFINRIKSRCLPTTKNKSFPPAEFIVSHQSHS